MKMKLKVLFAVYVSLLTLVGCNSSEEQVESSPDPIGGVVYGGVFRFMSKEKVQNLFPPATLDVYSSRITSQIFEGLVRIDPLTMDVIPSLAETMTVSDDGKIYTFRIRQNVYFTDDECFEGGKGRILTAEDFKYSLEFACSKHIMNEFSWLLVGKIQGAQEYFDGNAASVSGIEVIDENTLVITLVEPQATFLKVLTHSGLTVFPKEALEFYGKDIYRNPVGTGAFKLEVWSDAMVRLVRNDNYWRSDELGNPLPFLDAVEMTYSKTKADELIAFRNEEIDLVLDIPVEEVDNVLSSLAEAKDGANPKHKVDSKSSMSVQYLGFNNAVAPFDDVSVRRAFNLAIDREAIVDTWLEGEGWVLGNGFVPKMPDYPNESIVGHAFDLLKARALLDEAGYKDRSKFPKIDLYVNAIEGSSSHKMAQGVVFSLKQNLGIDLNIILCSIDERDKFIEEGKAIFWRSGWVADYPDPENFLNIFLSSANGDLSNKSLNTFNYKNPEFNELFKLSRRELNREKRMEMLAKCDQMIIDDAVVMPMLTEDFVTMVNLRIRRFVSNELEQIDFSTIFIKEIN
jgi:oligopeptide transport system substrate-binding protein